MEDRCKFSQLAIPNDPEYVSIAEKYAGGVAGTLGFLADEVVSIQGAVARVISSLIKYSFGPEERAAIEISCERVAEGLKVTIKDKGPPFDPLLLGETKPVPDAEGRISLEREILSAGEEVEEIHLHNLGPEGKETVLIKRLRGKSVSDYHDVCDLEPYPAPGERDDAPSSIEFKVRPMEPSDAVEVSKCIYKAYGHSYAYENAYYPERLIEANERGELFSVVAVTASDEIMGHVALQFRRGKRRIAELCQGVVKPEFRAQNCFTRMNAYLVEKAKSDGLMGVFGQAVTNHTYSQRVG